MADLYTLEMIYLKGRDFSFMIVYSCALVNVQKSYIQIKSEMKSLNTRRKTESILFDPFDPLHSENFF